MVAEWKGNGECVVPSGWYEAWLHSVDLLEKLCAYLVETKHIQDYNV